MSDVPESCRGSCPAGDRSATTRHTKTMDNIHLGKNGADHQDVSTIQHDPNHSLSASEAEASVKAGVKRTRDLGSEDDYGSTSDAGTVPYGVDAVSTVITRAKKLRISDSAADARDAELSQCLTIKKKHEGQGPEGPALQTKATQYLIMPVKPSLPGLPEELIIEILQGIAISDIMAIRRTNKRLSSVTRVRALWIALLWQLLDHIDFLKAPSPFIPSKLSTSALERVVVRPHVFDYRWFRNMACYETPTMSKVLSTSWSEPEDIRFPLLMPGGRWLIAACDDGRSFNSTISLWDIDHGALNWLPEVQILAEGRVLSLDMKMDRTGIFAVLAVLCEKEEFPEGQGFLHQVDIYQVVFRTDEEGSFFAHLDSFSMDTQRAWEVQIYPQDGRVIVNLFDRVLIWEYAYLNDLCGCMRTARRRVQHKRPHAMTLTHKYLLVADGDTCILRVFDIPPLSGRPTHLRDLDVLLIPPYLTLALPSVPRSLRFSTDRLVNIPVMAEISDPLPTTVRATPLGITTQVAHMPINSHHDLADYCFDPFGRGFLFLDATTCDSYLFYSFPIHEIMLTAGSSNTFCLTSTDRDALRAQAHSGAPASTDRSRSLPATSPAQSQVEIRKQHRGDALWVGTLGGISSSLMGRRNSPKFGKRNTALLRSPYDGSLVILSANVPPEVELGQGQSRIGTIEQGAVKTVFRIAPNGHANASGKQDVRVEVEEATVDEISGKVCLVEKTTVADKDTNQTKVRYKLKLLEYA